MAVRRKIATSLLAVAACAAVSLACGADYLGMSLPGGLPLGNLLAALGLCAAACAAVCLSTPGTLLRSVSTASLLGAALWLPVSIALAGNLRLNFSGWRGTAWLAFSLTIAAGVLAVMLWALAAAAMAGLRRRTTT